MIKKCIKCNKEFITYPSRIKIGEGKYCSKNCSASETQFIKGHITWNTGTKGIMKAWNKGLKGVQIAWNKGIPCSSETCLKISIANKEYGKTAHGYVYIYRPDHPYRDGKKSVLEHRLMVESQIGRYLLPKEEVHHINEVKSDNAPHNLMAFINTSAHLRFHKNPKNVKPEEIIFDGRKFNHHCPC